MSSSDDLLALEAKASRVASKVLATRDGSGSLSKQWNQVLDLRYPVIASAAKQSPHQVHTPRDLLRRCAPRNDTLGQQRRTFPVAARPPTPPVCNCPPGPETQHPPAPSYRAC